LQSLLICGGADNEFGKIIFQIGSPFDGCFQAQQHLRGWQGLMEKRLSVDKWSREELIEEVERLRRDCSEAYQAVGNIADTLNYWDGNHSYLITKLMDNLSAAADGYPRPHADLLPFIMPTRMSAGEKAMLLRQLQEELSRWDEIRVSAGNFSGSGTLMATIDRRRQKFKERAEAAIASGNMNKALVALFTALETDA
jgi:hypothetical protein